MGTCSIIYAEGRASLILPATSKGFPGSMGCAAAQASSGHDAELALEYGRLHWMKQIEESYCQPRLLQIWVQSTGHAVFAKLKAIWSSLSAKDSFRSVQVSVPLCVIKLALPCSPTPSWMLRFPAIHTASLGLSHWCGGGLRAAFWLFLHTDFWPIFSSSRFPAVYWYAGKNSSWAIGFVYGWFIAEHDRLYSNEIPTPPLRCQCLAMLGNDVLALSISCIILALIYLSMPYIQKKTSFRGHHAFISGGSTGIGLALTFELLLDGANVTIVARTQSKLDNAVEELEDFKLNRNLGGTIQAISADVTDSAQVWEWSIV